MAEHWKESTARPKLRSEIPMPRMHRRNPLQKPRSSTAVNYIIDERAGLFYCVVYDLRIADQLAYMGRSLEPAMLGAVSVNSGNEADKCSVDYAVARKGYGPLLYDLTARGLELYVKGCDALLPSQDQSPYAQRLWKRLKTEELLPIGDRIFSAKYAMTASAMEKQGRKIARGRKIGPSNRALEQAAYEMFDKYVAVGGVEKTKPVPLDRLLAQAGYAQ